MQSGPNTFAYDANGNLLNGNGPLGFTSYQYDPLNRLVRASTAAGDTRFAYNAMGHRVAKTDATGATPYLIDPFGAGDLSQVVRETSAAGEVDYVLGAGTLVSMRRDAVTSYFLHDARKSTRMLADTAGVLTDRYDYDAFGNMLARQGSTANEYLFAAQRLDDDVRFYDLKARYYDPVRGQFVSRDPHPGNPFDPSSLHPYPSAHNDPVNRSDPSGRFTLLEAMQHSVGVGILAGQAYSLQNYYYYRSAELAFEVGVDAFLSYRSLTMDAIGASAFFRIIGATIARSVANALANKTLLNQTARNVGKSVETRLLEIVENVACRTNNPTRCLKVTSAAETEAFDAAERAVGRGRQDVQAALAEVKRVSDQAARRGADNLRKTTVTYAELAEVIWVSTKEAFSTAVDKFQRLVVPRFRD